MMAKTTFRRILILLFALALAALCALMYLTYLNDTSNRPDEVINTYQTEFRVMIFLIGACIAGLAISFILAFAFKNRPDRRTQTLGRIVTLLTAGIAVSISVTAAVALFVPGKVYQLDYLFDTDYYSVLNTYEAPPTDKYLSPGSINCLASMTSTDDGRSCVYSRVILNLENTKNYDIMSLRCIAVADDGTAYGVFYLPVSLDPAELMSSSKTFKCIFPTLPDGVNIVFELYYRDYNGNYCFETETVKTKSGYIS